MTAQRAVHRLMTLAERIPHIGFVYRTDLVSRSGRLLGSLYVAIDSITWC
jgi:hypothetical protein